jgi:transcriptional regulator GlxA family with amidase domain
MPRRKVRIGVLAYEGCMSSAVAGLLDAFHIANRIAAWMRADAPVFVTTVLGLRRVVRGSAGFRIASEPLGRSARLDVAVVPPMLSPPEETLAANAAVVDWLKRYARGGGIAASVCVGALFLARAGLLEGREFTTNPAFAPALLREHAGARLDRRIVDDGRVVTAGTTTSFLDLAIHLVDRFAGHEVAVATAKALSVDKNRGSQLPYYLPFAEKNHGDSAVLALQGWLEEHFAKPLTAEAMARRAAMSQRSLNRRFLAATRLTPRRYLARLRIEAAKRLLETTDRTVQEITSAVGYEDTRSFARSFRASVGLVPAAYRKRFADLAT